MEPPPAAGARRLRAALGTRGVLAAIMLTVAARAPGAAVPLLLLLRADELGGGYVFAGLTAGAFGLGFAVGSPVLGRLVDRRGQTAVLLTTALLTGAALGLAGSQDAPREALALLAALAGALHPPVEACARVVIAQALPDDAERHAALTAEASGQELSFMIGPLLFVTLASSGAAGTGLVAAAVTIVASALAFATLPGSRAARRSRGGDGRSFGGALRSPGVQVLVGVMVSLGTCFGANTVALTAAAAEAGNDGASGLLVAAYALGSLLAGLAAALGRPPRSAMRALIGLLLASGVGHAVLATLTSSLLELGAGLAIAGAAIAPSFGIAFLLTSWAAPSGAETETFTWLGSGVFAGTALGSALGGLVVGMAGASAGFIVAGFALMAGAVVVTLWRAVLPGS